MFFVFAMASLALMAHAVFASSPTTQKVVYPPWWSLIALSAVEALAFVLWLRPAVGTVAWLFFFGDSNDRWDRYGWILPYIYTSLAVTPVLAATARIGFAGTTLSYLRLHFFGTLTLLLSFATAFLANAPWTVEGLTAGGAARNVARRFQDRSDVPLTLVEDRSPLPRGLAGEARRYWLIGPEEPHGRFVILPHSWIGWQFGRSHTFGSSKANLTRARQYLTANPERAILTLQEVVENYPNTPAQAEARRLLALLGAKEREEPLP